MTDKQQWSLFAGIAMTLVFGTALAIRIRAQVDVPGVGSRAPDFRALNVATGRPASLADYRGKVVLLNVWATWCQPCRIEMPSMERLYREFAGSDFRVAAVSVDRADSATVAAFASELSLTFDVLHDQAGTIQQTYQTNGVPESFVIDRDGLIVKKVLGAAAWDGPANETLIRWLLDAR